VDGPSPAFPHSSSAVQLVRSVSTPWRRVRQRGTRRSTRHAHTRTWAMLERSNLQFRALRSCVVVLCFELKKISYAMCRAVTPYANPNTWSPRRSPLCAGPLSILKSQPRKRQRPQRQRATGKATPSRKRRGATAQSATARPRGQTRLTVRSTQSPLILRDSRSSDHLGKPWESLG
jgi:hypothetical protein